MRCPQCGKRGLKGRQGVAMHVGRVHSQIITPPPGGRKRPSINLEDHTDHEPSTHVAVATRTTRMRRTEEATVTESVAVQQFTVNGCPNCLQPLTPMNDGYAKMHMPPPPFCPFCTCPVGMVRTALRVQTRIERKGELVPA